MKNPDIRTIEPIAYIHNDFSTKFGLPRQSGLCENINGVIEFVDKYRSIDSIRGLEEFSHVWLIWGFSENISNEYRPLVRPPRLGGNEKIGVFATRASFRPNALALSVVKIEAIDTKNEKGPIITVSGIDMKDGSPIYDIKPYLPYVDICDTAKEGFTSRTKDYKLRVEIPKNIRALFDEDKLETLIQILSLDPRPAYQTDETRVYGFEYCNRDVRFKVEKGVIKVCEAVAIKGKETI